MVSKVSSTKWSLIRPLLTLYFAFKDKRTPWYAKLTTFLAGAYLLSPVDIIPDVIPVAGYLDDLVIVPLLLRAATSMLPTGVHLLAHQRAIANQKRLRWMLAAFVLVIAALLVWLFVTMSHRSVTPSSQVACLHHLTTSGSSEVPIFCRE